LAQLRVRKLAAGDASASSKLALLKARTFIADGVQTKVKAVS
jgi:hypothetical protein